MKILEKMYVVTPDMTASKFASGTLDVLATPALVAFMEDTAKEIVDADLSKEQSSVGISVSTSHIKASKVGARIKIVATLISQEGKIYNFDIKAYENDVLIGEGRHTRAVINVEKFLEKLN